MGAGVSRLVRPARLPTMRAMNTLPQPFWRHAAAVLALLAATWSTLPAARAQQSDAAEAQKLHALFERQWEDSAVRFPEFGTFRGDTRFNDRLADVSPAAQAERDRVTDAFLAEARAITRDKLGATDRVSLDMFIDSLQRQAALRPYPAYALMSLRALGGPQNQFGDLLQMMPTATVAQYEQMLARMAALPTRMDQEIANLKRAAAGGWVPARDVLLAAVRQIDGQLPSATLAPEATPFLRPFAKLATDTRWPAAEREGLQKRSREALDSHIVPALGRLRALITDELLPKAPPEGSLARHPDGPKIYELLVRQQTTTDMPAAEIHAVGLRELARLRGEMEAVMRQVRFEGDFAAFIQHLNSDPKFFHPSSEALLAGYREIAKRIDAELPKLFAELPRAPYGIVAMPAHMGNRAEYYNRPTLDGSRAGFFFASVGNPRTRPTWGMETLTVHETVPGHHLQNARAIELRGLPAFRRGGFGYTAYGEGWALYAETLGPELGLYADPYSRFGHLQAQAFRAARLVVDTGMHSFAWSRQRCIDFMVERTGQQREFITGEIDRYASQPGQALAYMIGKLKFDELRDRAKARLGARFDIRQFHNAVLDQGALPLATLDRLVDEWIAGQLKG
jgi:uncharacterized protein (DUF885 family)